MLRRIATFLLPALAVLPAVPAAAQFPVTLTGTIEKAPADPCNAKATHRVRCTDILLRSDQVDLSKLEGRTLKMVGVRDLALTCNTIRVDSTETPKSTATSFSLGGYRRGSTVILTTLAPPGSFVAWLFASEAGFLPLGALGTYQLQLASTTFLTIEPTIGVSIKSARIPDDPELIGSTCRFQNAILQTIGGLSVEFNNSACFTIR